MSYMDRKQIPEAYRTISDDLFRITPLVKKQIARMPVFHSENGLPMSHYQLLSLLDERDSMSVTDISEYFNIAKPNITPLVDRLVDENLVRRERSSADRRVVYIAIRPEGRKRLGQMRDALNAHVAQLHQKMGDETFDCFARALDDLCDILKKL